MAKHHQLIAGPETVHWGYYDARLKPVLTVDSGDTVTVHTLSGGPGDVHPDRKRVPPDLLAIHQKCRHGAGAHIMTGPIALRGAKPGQALELRILDIQFRFDWGYNRFMPLKGTLPEDFPKFHRVFVEIDREKRLADWGAGVKIPLRPFFGNIGVAPPPNMGEIPSNPPTEHGGNMDNKELVPGATLYLPIWNEGALLSIGDGHGVQGDGEVDQTALETGLVGTFEVRLREDLTLKLPRAETPTCYMTMGFDADLDDAAKTALREMIDFLSSAKGLSREDAYVLSSLAVDLHITQLVNGNKGVHATIAKSIVD
ncbi:MAG: acetamidase/formamidase family protein [Nitrospinota bacterium]